MAIVSKPKTLLFDLGGVIVPWVGIDALAAFNNTPRETAADMFGRNEIFQAFERGKISEAHFLETLSRVFNLPESNLAALWNSWVHPPFPGILAALTELKTRFTIGCLSNTNSLHWTHLNGLFDTDGLFDFPFASHHLQEAKPDAACFIKALKIMGAAPEDVWFFDDSRANVDAARKLGLTAYAVDRDLGVLPLLQELELISRRGPKA